MEYLRIGTEYFKKCKMPLFSGDKLNVLVKWNKGEIITDHGKDFLASIEKYDGFVTIPDHQNYKKVIDTFYNKYEELEHNFSEGEFPNTTLFLKHIFGEHFELGLDYLSILWQKPTQILPILCLVSSERKTGKTTFLTWLKLIFQGNMTINKNEDFRSQFNSDWASKLIVSIDEVLLDKKEDSERIKNLSTANSFKTEAKGKDKVESFFFGKFILCSNNEDSFIKIDENEIRYWVLKVPSLSDADENPDLEADLRTELNAFMFYLNSRKIKSKRKTRMWFTKEQIYTEALKNLKFGNKTNIYKELCEILLDDFIKFEVTELKYSLGDLVSKLIKSNIRVSTSSISKCLKEDFKIESTNGSYKTYYLTDIPGDQNILGAIKQRGRYYGFSKKDFLKP